MSFKPMRSACPGIGCRNGRIIDWICSGCHSRFEINDDAMARCSKCLVAQMYFNWRFICEKHWGEAKAVDLVSMMFAFGVLSDFSDTDDKIWIIKLTKRLAEEYAKKVAQLL